MFFLLLACDTSPKESASSGACISGDTLFGRPNAMTGLGDDQCGPSCTCAGEGWLAPDYSEADANALLSWTLSVPFPELTSDPYLLPAASVSEAAVCGFINEGNQRYHLTTFDSAQAATAAGAHITHTSACGVCSTLTDLSVYMRVLDLTEPVRACGLENMGGSQEAHVACLQALGFTLPCAQIWYWNTLHTQQACLVECLADLEAPYNNPDGSLNSCLQCDEDASGPVFKVVAGRTRRNTGIPNAICRPCEEVFPLTHFYP